MSKATATMLVCFFVVSCGDSSILPRQGFDASRWAATPAEHRYAMATDLVNSRRLIGLSLDEVEALLGTPSSVAPDKSRVAYVVKQGGIGFDSVYALELRFEAATGRVSNASVRGD